MRRSRNGREVPEKAQIKNATKRDDGEWGTAGTPERAGRSARGASKVTFGAAPLRLVGHLGLGDAFSLLFIFFKGTIYILLENGMVRMGHDQVWIGCLMAYLVLRPRGTDKRGFGAGTTVPRRGISFRRRFGDEGLVVSL